MTAKQAGKGRRAAARRPDAGSAPATEDRLSRLEIMLERLLAGAVNDGTVGVTIHTAKEMAGDPGEEDGDDLGDLAAAKARKAAREKEEEGAADRAMALIDPRHREIFDWLCEVQGKRPAQILKEMLRASLIRERQAYREARGKGGSSSRDAAALAERLPRH